MRTDFSISLLKNNCFLVTCIVGVLLPALLSEAVASDFPFVSRFSQIYEPSGVIISASSDILIVEDEGDDPLHITSFANDSPPIPLTLSIPVSDLEGVALGRDETVFLITSFSTTKKNKRKQKRERLIQLKVKGDRVVDEHHFND